MQKPGKNGKSQSVMMYGNDVAALDKLLAKGHDEEAADYALAWLTERSLLNDMLFAESVVRSYTRKGYGAARIRQELTRRGIDRDTAEAAMQTLQKHMHRQERAMHWKRMQRHMQIR